MGGREWLFSLLSVIGTSLTYILVPTDERREKRKEIHSHSFHLYLSCSLISISYRLLDENMRWKEVNGNEGSY